MHPNTKAILRHFKYKHLPGHLQAISFRFHSLAHGLVELPDLDGPELTMALRKLLEAKDCAVRAALPPEDEDPEPDDDEVDDPEHDPNPGPKPEIPAGYKVYGWQSQRGATTTREIGAFRSKAAVGRACGEDPRRLFNLSETGNHIQIHQALSKLDTVFWASDTKALRAGCVWKKAKRPR